MQRSLAMALLGTALSVGLATPASAAPPDHAANVYSLTPTTIASFDTDRNRLRLSSGDVVRYDNNDVLFIWASSAYFWPLPGGARYFCYTEGRYVDEASFERRLSRAVEGPTYTLHGTISRSPKGESFVAIGMHDPLCPYGRPPA